MFFLFISGTELSKIAGLSAAGANPAVIPYTSPVDADLIQFGSPQITDLFPMDPQGHPTPAIITRAAVVEADIPVCIVRCGTYLPPAPPYVELGAEFGKDPTISAAVPDAMQIYERAKIAAQNLAGQLGDVVLGESIPAGTTTALLALRALGMDGMVSSGGPENPTALKDGIWQRTAARLGIQAGDLADEPLRVVAEMGDPMQAAVLGFIQGTPSETRITLAGGTQMLAVAALLSKINPARKPLVATTRYVVEDTSCTFKKLAEKIGVETYTAQLDFSDSPYTGLSDYEKGYVKEGAGAGGAVLYAKRLGVDVRCVVERTNALYSKVAPPTGK